MEYQTFMVDIDQVLTPGEFRVLLRMRSRGFCERMCGRRGVEAHHIDRDKLNSTLRNGEFLCLPCHKAEHAEEQRRRAAGRLTEWQRVNGGSRKGKKHKPETIEKLRAVARAR